MVWNAKKLFKYWIFSGLHLPAFLQYCITAYIFSLNARKYWPEKTPNSNAFHVVLQCLRKEKNALLEEFVTFAERKADQK